MATNPEGQSEVDGLRGILQSHASLSKECAEKSQASIDLLRKTLDDQKIDQDLFADVFRSMEDVRSLANSQTLPPKASSTADTGVQTDSNVIHAGSDPDGMDIGQQRS